MFNEQDLVIHRLSKWKGFVLSSPSPQTRLVRFWDRISKRFVEMEVLVAELMTPDEYSQEEADLMRTIRDAFSIDSK